LDDGRSLEVGDQNARQDHDDAADHAVPEEGDVGEIPRGEDDRLSGQYAKESSPGPDAREKRSWLAFVKTAPDRLDPFSLPEAP